MPMAYAALPRVPGPWVFSREWTTEDRLRLTQLLAAVIRDDLGQGRYSQPGRPNLTSILEMVDASPLVLEEHRESNSRRSRANTRGRPRHRRQRELPPAS